MKIILNNMLACNNPTKTMHISKGKLLKDIFQKLRPTEQHGETGVSLSSIYFPLISFSLKSLTQV
jgi:hypothetical protein